MGGPTFVVTFRAVPGRWRRRTVLEPRPSRRAGCWIERYCCGRKPDDSVATSSLVRGRAIEMSGGVYVISGNVLAGLWALSGLAVSLAMTYALAANEKLSTDDVPIYVIGLVLFAGDGLLGLGLSAVGWKDGVTWVLRWMPLLAVAGVAIQV